MSWIFACGLRFNRKSQPCIFLRWFALRFPVKMYAKKTRRRFLQSVVERQVKETFCFPEQWNQRSVPWPPVFCIRFYSKMKRKPAEKIQGCDFILNRRPHAKIQLIWTKKKKKRTKIRHRMVMLRRLQLIISITKCEDDNLHKLPFTSAENITKNFISTRKMEKRNKIRH